MGLFNLLFGRFIDHRIAEYQSDLMTKYCDEVPNIYRTMRGWRHDYHNHIQTLIALCDDEAKTREYLLKLNDDLVQIDMIIKTGKSYLSTKAGDGHGFGLMRVDRIVDKYNGYVNRQNEGGVFATEVMLPL